MATTLTRGTTRTRSNLAAPWRHVDFALLVTVLLIAALGILMIYSATQRRLDLAGLDPQLYMKRQLIYVAVGLIGMVIVTIIDYRLFRDFAPLLYAATLVGLLLVLSPLGATKKGTQAWFQLGSFQLQPSEFAKLVLIIWLAAYCSEHRGQLELPAMARVLVTAGVPIALIQLQPDLGTSLVFVAILLGVLLVAGAQPRHLAALALMGIVAVAAVIQLGVLKEYQLDRLGAFLDPEHDTARSAYNLNQSKIAIGSGGFTGKGLYKGTQTNLSYVPEQQTDFIFTVVGEELGLVGSSVLLMLFAFLIWRIWRVAVLAKDLSGTLVCVGVLSMFMFQIFENIGMTTGIMPVTGIPLPFMSFGGSSTMAGFVAIGLVLNVHMRRFS